MNQQETVEKVIEILEERILIAQADEILHKEADPKEYGECEQQGWVNIYQGQQQGLYGGINLIKQALCK